MQQLGDVQGRKRSLFSSLEHKSVPACQSRPNFPGKHQQWKVPWDDLTCNANWLVQYLYMVWSVSRHNEPMDLISPTCRQTKKRGTNSDMYVVLLLKIT